MLQTTFNITVTRSLADDYEVDFYKVHFWRLLNKFWSYFEWFCDTALNKSHPVMNTLHTTIYLHFSRAVIGFIMKTLKFIKYWEDSSQLAESSSKYYILDITIVLSKYKLCSSSCGKKIVHKDLSDLNCRFRGFLKLRHLFSGRRSKM